LSSVAAYYERVSRASLAFHALSFTLRSDPRFEQIVASLAPTPKCATRMTKGSVLQIDEPFQ